MKVLRSLADSHQADSFATSLRRRRFSLFTELLATVPRPCTILDVGGTDLFWETMGFTDRCDISISLLNVYPLEISHPMFRSLAGDARDMREFADGQFDVVFSNSVIEHLGGREDQQRMADEVRRVGRRYFIQTPNRSFPLEPHFLFPGFQFLPESARVFLVQHFDLGWYAQGKIPDRERALETIRSIQLLGERDLRSLFPEATIYRERFFAMKKSLVALHGWEP